MLSQSNANPPQGAEGHRTAATTTGTTASAPPKARSCLVCKNRKVRCDKRSPCSNCRRAGISCIYPTTDSAPRWARRAEHMVRSANASGGHTASSIAKSRGPQRSGPEVTQLVTKLQALENVVKDLRGQLRHTQTEASPNTSRPLHEMPADSSSPRPLMEQEYLQGSPAASTDSGSRSLGRMVQQDTGHARYVSSRFWSRVIDELKELNVDADSLLRAERESSDGELSSHQTPSTFEMKRTPLDRYAFLFRNNLGNDAPASRELHPLPSQIPFIVDVFSENVNLIIQVVHIPTIKQIVRELRSKGTKSLNPDDEALMFSIYYAAVTSMEEEDVVTNFNKAKAELNLTYRLGLEYALARADFLSVPNLKLVQALAIFLLLARRYDSPRFVWMMTGLLIRMAHSLGLHRDGSQFSGLLPYDIEMRRRVWWAICLIDVRASEDQGTEFSIGSFDTRLPLNINDTDIQPGTQRPIIERSGLTDISLSLLTCATCDVSRQVMALATSEGMPNIDQQERLINELYEKMEKDYLQYADPATSILAWVASRVAKLVMAKLRLFIYLPILFLPSSEQISENVRDQLFLAAIEVAEHNHALNAETACRHLRWIFQTYTHWHAIVFLLIEITHRPWSPLVDRAWIILHSVWLIPQEANVDDSLEIWVPLRRLMNLARKHQEMEWNKLLKQPPSADWVESELQKLSSLGSSGTFSEKIDIVQQLRERWSQLLTGTGSQSAMGSSKVSLHTTASVDSTDCHTTRPVRSISTAYASKEGNEASRENEIANFDPSGRLQASWNNWAGEHTSGPGFVSHLWGNEDGEQSIDAMDDMSMGEFNLDMDLDNGGVNWQDWFQMVQNVDFEGVQDVPIPN